MYVSVHIRLGKFLYGLKVTLALDWKKFHMKISFRFEISKYKSLHFKLNQINFIKLIHLNV